MPRTSTAVTPLVQQAWQRCADRLLPPLSPEASTKLFHEFIYDRYTEPQRHYHNLQHLEEMLGYLIQYEQEHGWHGDYTPALATAVNKDAVPPQASRSVDAVQHDWVGTVLLLSILFHDVVYDPKRSDNEEASAALALEFLDKAEGLYKTSCENLVTVDTTIDAPPSSSSSVALWADVAAAQYVRVATNDYILKTKVHLSVAPETPLQLSALPTPSAVAACHDNPLHVFLDLDLSILGHADAGVYRDRYAANIRREYSHYPLASFLKGRADFLNSFLSNPQWYKTPYFFVLLEAQARRNVAVEVSELTAQLNALKATAPSAS